ncbi:thermonuclease family protein [Bacillus sp. FJAT-27445]|uniref:thermonuclease family protein n=1 Tax=Bacillus sp. FJAT-27445 TaxID=1679166 RepID=UPI000A850F55|nr:thermonuclease family protein [Bacillus sp. FJAT-27445]
MKLFKTIIMILLLLFLLILSTAAPIALIGVALYGAGFWLSHQKSKGRVYFKKPWLLLTAGVLSTFILVGTFAEATEGQASSKPEVKIDKQASDKKAAKEKDKADEKAKAALLAKNAAEEKAKAEEAEKAKAEAEAKKQAEEKANAEAEAKKQAEAKQKAEAEARKQAEAKQRAEAEAKAKQAANTNALVAALALEKVTVGRVVDGDTIETSDGRKIRFIGVNTPESTTRHEKYGKEASNYTKSKLDGKQIWIQKDVSNTDRYGRLLRIIWLAVPTDDMNEKEIRAKMFNAELVLNGYAEPSTYTPDVKYSEFFVKFAREARQNNKGLWAYGPNGTTKGDLDPKTSTQSSSQPKPAASQPAKTTVKPAAPAPSTSTQTEIFANCTELRQKYPNGVPSTHPAYQAKMDRDKDNYACER